MKPYSALTVQEKTVEVARWLCVPAAAGLLLWFVILLAGVAMPRAMAQLPGTPPPPPPLIPRIVLFRLFSAIAAVAFIVAGAKMAPRGRVIVATVLAVLWLGHAFLYRIYVHLGQGAPHYLDFALAITAALAAVVLIVYAERARMRAAAKPYS